MQVDSRWIDIVHGKPILRGRTNIFGSGADYGKTLFAGGTVWRAGANVSTRLRTYTAPTTTEPTTTWRARRRASETRLSREQLKGG